MPIRVRTGVDIAEVARVRAALTRRPGLLARLFTEEEVASCGDGAGRWGRLAARFAAKEAVIKAAGGLHGGSWRDVAVIRRPGGEPEVRLGGALGAWIRAQGWELALSLSHERHWVVAQAVLYREH
ncbi:Holo-[acyl-carrier-protein] synthase [Candidatus Hydrogenisulfobacillus filiaventi]|uniref:Holo-[acyl-carrier-protein] synthase n=1 Tax=Candidatus Hydrogenisulfobacillus filiaventi TaxID=2707344 RepID=A0A6F8ZH32_9FIRM|nr:holo-ACP synthase [Bacillota bacterium]CAB1129295.1 Holo-[acyl-carrier-protein] synthase [Candidatus Hydrogenisulfobacillus filiaventi]